MVMKQRAPVPMLEAIGSLLVLSSMDIDGGI